MIYMRGQARDYDQWADITGDDTWRWDNVLPATPAPRRPLAAGPARRERGLPFRCTATRPPAARANGAWKAAPALGHPGRLCPGRAAGRHSATDDFNAAPTRAWATLRSTRRTAGAGTPPRPFAPDLLRPAQLRDVDRRQGRCIARRSSPTVAALHRRRGGRARDGHRPRRGRGHPERGQRNSPQLLQLSGIGLAALLRQHGIEVADLPGVGANLQDHLQIRAVYKVQARRRSTPWPARWWARPRSAEYALNRSGPMSMAPSQLGAFTRSAPDQPGPTSSTTCSRCRWTPLASRCTASGLHRQRVQPQPHQPRLGVIKNAASRSAPAIAPNYLSTPKTARWRPTACASRAASWPAGAGRYQPRNGSPAQYQSDEDWRAPGGRHRHHHLPPGGHREDGPRRRPDGGARRADAGARRAAAVRPARGGRRRHAHHHQRQHQLAHADDGRSSGPGPTRRVRGRSGRSRGHSCRCWPSIRCLSRGLSCAAAAHAGARRWRVSLWFICCYLRCLRGYCTRRASAAPRLRALHHPSGNSQCTTEVQGLQCNHSRGSKASQMRGPRRQTLKPTDQDKHPTRCAKFSALAIPALFSPARAQRCRQLHRVATKVIAAEGAKIGRWNGFSSPSPLALAGFIDAIVAAAGDPDPGPVCRLPRGSTATLFGTNKAGSVGTAMATWQCMPPRKCAGRPAARSGSGFSRRLAGAWTVTAPVARLLRRCCCWCCWPCWPTHPGQERPGPPCAPLQRQVAEVWVASLVGLGIGFTTCFGPGTGSFFVFLFVRLLGYDFLNASAFGQAAQLRHQHRGHLAVCLQGPCLVALRGDAGHRQCGGAAWPARTWRSHGYSVCARHFHRGGEQPDPEDGLRRVPCAEQAVG